MRDGDGAGPEGVGERLAIAAVVATLVGPWLLGVVQALRAVLRRLG